MTSAFDILKTKLSQFYELPDDAIKKIGSFTQNQVFSPRELLLAENDLEDNIFLIVNGLLRKYFMSGGQEFITAFYLEGDFAHSAVSFYTNTPSLYYIQALEKTTCLSIKKADLEHILAVVPGAEKVFRLVLASLYVKKELHEYQRASQSKQERFLHFCRAEPELFRRVSQKHLASYLGMAPETFCRLKHLLYKRHHMANGFPDIGTMPGITGQNRPHNAL